MNKFPITLNGYEKLKIEIKNLKNVERPLVISQIAVAREFGDLSENAEYKAAKEKQSILESKILELENKLANSEIIDISKLSGDIVKFGATVELIDMDTDKKLKYHIVGEYEANIKKRMISISSPISKELISKKIGDLVEVNTISGIKCYKILRISFTELDI